MPRRSNMSMWKRSHRLQATQVCYLHLLHPGMQASAFTPQNTQAKTITQLALISRCALAPHVTASTRPRRGFNRIRNTKKLCLDVTPT
eukprot:6428978-Prymnesium_polylepis.1